MVDTFYLHLEFAGKNGWSINLPFLCTRCGNCCTLEDFLTAGKLNGALETHPDAHAKANRLYEELGNLWAENQAKYDNHITRNPCPFLVSESCSIYEIRPDGCRLFPKTAFGMESQDCEPLKRFKKMCAALEKGRNYIEHYYFVGKNHRLSQCDEPITPAKFTQKQYQACVAKLRQAGMTDDELTLFHYFNGQNKSRVQC